MKTRKTKKTRKIREVQTTAYGVLIDETSGKKLKAWAEFNRGKICIHVEGYGEKTANDGMGEPVVVDLFDNKLKVYIWSDINKEDPTNIISLEGAKEILRKEDHN